MQINDFEIWTKIMTRQIISNRASHRNKFLTRAPNQNKVLARTQSKQTKIQLKCTITMKFWVEYPIKSKALTWTHNQQRKITIFPYLTSHNFCPKFKLFCLNLKDNMILSWKLTRYSSYKPFIPLELKVKLDPQRKYRQNCS